jgi:hypothetical protein
MTFSPTGACRGASELLRATTSRSSLAWLALSLVALVSSACITVAGNGLSDVELRRPDGSLPTIEQTIGDDFSFHLDGGKMITSVKAGRNVNQMILTRWKKQGLISKENYVKSAQFSGKADYNLTLGGHQEGESSIALQVLSGLTLFLIPYSVNTQLDLEYTIEHVASGKRFEAKAADSFQTVIELFLLPISPFALGGSTRTYERLADHLYNGLAVQGAFDPDTWQTTSALELATPADGPDEQNAEELTPVERLRVLDRLRSKGAISQDEYERKKADVLKEL